MAAKDLIDTLATDLRPVRPGAARVWLGGGLAAGVIAAFALLIVWLGFRPDLRVAVSTYPFWMKWGFTLSVAVIGAALVARLSRPEARVGRAWLWAAAPSAVLLALAAIEQAGAPAAARLPLLLGGSWNVCPFRILAFAAPIYVATVLALRRLAPTRLAQAGFAAGLLAGGAGASVYALFCPESAASFVAVWYGLGVLASGAIGALIGKWALRW